MGGLPVTARLRLRLVLLFVLAWSAALVSGAGAALAHESLTASEPADGAVLATAPQQLTLNFTGPPDADAMRVVLRNLAGDEVATGQPTADGTALTVGLIEPLANGVYTLEWSGTFDDGHEVGGTLSFTVQATGAATGTTQQVATTGQASGGDDGTPVWPWLVAAAVAAAGVVVFLVRRRRAG